MTYRDILMEQKKHIPLKLQWWPDFFYHFTDVHNVVNILKFGWLMSRDQAMDQGIMEHDNASRAVISATNRVSKSYGRLYFRPLTPTQYHNEGYKPQGIRNEELNASCPIPVFLCLDSGETMEYPGTKFAAKGIAGNRQSVQEGEEAFSKLNFSKIYHDGWFDSTVDGDIKDYRHSEVIHEGGFPVEPLLKVILCRSIAEKETLLYLLNNYSTIVYNKFKDKILFRPKLRCFYNNGVFLKKVMMCNGALQLEFNEPEQRMKKGEAEVYFDICVDLVYAYGNGQVVFAETRRIKCNYSRIRRMSILLAEEIDCEVIRCKVFFDGEVMYENELAARESELI